MENSASLLQSPASHKAIAEKLEKFYHNFESLIDGLGALGEFFSTIPYDQPPGPRGETSPFWSNIYFPMGDAIALCAFLVKYNPAVYFEIGSGNTTKFARKTISHFNLRTKIISVDPYPRAEIDALCDETVRAPMQMVPVEVFEKLRKDSILFIDGSHICHQNTDVTYTFLNVLPKINPGVIVHFHDIFWPLDYPPEWKERFYNEQYLLGTLLLFGSGYEILYSSAFAVGDPQLTGRFISVLRPFFSGKCHCGGGSLWLKFNNLCS
jgi:hypothetical protein